MTRSAPRFTRVIAISELLVVDASIAVCWLMPDEHEPVADAILTKISASGGVVPGIFWYEVRNSLVVNERRGRLTFDDTSSALHMLADLPLALDSSLIEDDVIALCRLHRLTIYDASYLEVAKRRGLGLATFDGPLAKAAQAEGVAAAAP